jgi:expansin (peptidoglycan-binding protein)
VTPERLKVLAEEAAEEYEVLRAARMALGEQKYGPGKWMTVDTMEEALFEIADLGNYAQMTFVRIRILQAQLEELTNEESSKDFTKELEA